MSLLITASCIFGLVVLLWTTWLFSKRPRNFNSSAGGVNVTPPVVTGRMPFVGCGLQFIKNPRAFLEHCRRVHGDTFILHLFGIKLFCLFSLEGLSFLYQVREADASFTEATRGLLGLKVPNELTDGSMAMFHRGLKKQLLEGYLEHVNAAAVETLRSLGTRGQFEIFSFMKQLIHKVGFLCWVGQEVADPENLEQFVRNFEKLDPEQGFKNLAALLWTLLSNKWAEKRALNNIEQVIRRIWTEREKKRECISDNLTSLYEACSHLPEDRRHRAVAIEVVQFHMASQANMYAALSWTLINLLLHQDVCMERMIDEITKARRCQGDQLTYDLALLDELTFVEDMVQESLRLAQQSITLRKVMKPCQFGDFQIPPGYYLATLLSITNQQTPSDQPPADQFWPFRSLTTLTGTAQYAVSTFGHGYHACPGQRFAMMVTKVFLIHLTTGPHSLTLQPDFTDVEIPPSFLVHDVIFHNNCCHLGYK
jgi:cytochrome P450